MFHEFRSIYPLFRNDFPDPVKFYKRMCAQMQAHASAEPFAVEQNRCLCEQFWYENGSPYYKVDNVAVELFSSVNMDIPFRYLTVPFNCFCIRFEGDNPLRVQSMLVAKTRDVDGGEHFYLWVDSGSFDRGGAPELEYVHMMIGEKTINDSIRELPVSTTGSDLRKDDRDKALVSIALSVCFLATSSDKMIRPDVLSKDLATWIDARRRQDRERQNIIEERAKRRGKVGFVVSGERDLLHREYEHHDGHGRELSYRHVRSAHFRHHQSGKVSFIRQTIVRPDLPVR